MSKDEKVLLSEIVSYQNELKLLLDEEDELSMGAVSDAVLAEKREYRNSLLEKIGLHTSSLIDLGVSFGARKIDPRKLGR